MFESLKLIYLIRIQPEPMLSQLTQGKVLLKIGLCYPVKQVSLVLCKFFRNFIVTVFVYIISVDYHLFSIMSRADFRVRILIFCFQLSFRHDMIWTINSNGVAAQVLAMRELLFRWLLSSDIILDAFLLSYCLKLDKDLAELVLNFFSEFKQLGVPLVIEYFFIKISIFYHLESF